MNKNFSDFGGFPTDNSSSTNLKYDIIASKFMTGVENHKKRTTTTPSFRESFGLLGAILQLFAAIFIILVFIVNWIYRRF